MSNKSPFFTDARIRKWLFRGVEIATVIQTAPATWRLLDTYTDFWWEKVAGVATVEGVFLAFWEWSRMGTPDKAGRIFRMGGLVAMWFVLLFVAVEADGLSAWPTRIASGLVIAHDIVPVLTNWLRTGKAARDTGKSLDGFERRLSNQFRRKAYRAEVKIANFASVYKEKLKLGIAHELQSLENDSTLKQDGKTTCEVVEKDGKFRAECQVCPWKSSEWFQVHQSAASSGDGHRCER